MSLLSKTKSLKLIRIHENIQNYILSQQAKSLPIYQSIASYQKWFNSRGTATNPFVDGPDYTFLDGRPTPLRVGQKMKANIQKDNVIKAMTLLKEIDFAVERHKNMTEGEKEEKRRIIESKLKAKAFKFEWEERQRRN